MVVVQAWRYAHILRGHVTFPFPMVMCLSCQLASHAESRRVGGTQLIKTNARFCLLGTLGMLSLITAVLSHMILRTFMVSFSVPSKSH